MRRIVDQMPASATQPRRMLAAFPVQMIRREARVQQVLERASRPLRRAATPPGGGERELSGACRETG